MFLPLVAEALSLITRGLRWLSKDYWTRIPLAILFVFLFHLFTGMLAQEVFPTMDPVNYYTWCVLGLFLILFFPVYLFRTLKGYFALMDEAPAEDGTVSDPVVINLTILNYHLLINIPHLFEVMLEGLRGKLKEVACEAAPQSQLQVAKS